jgi:hypothetical protein
LRQALFAWLLQVFAESADPARLRRSLDHWVETLARLARAMSQTAPGRERKALDAHVRRVHRNLLERVGKEATQEVADKTGW